jgi:hypothetical protein
MNNLTKIKRAAFILTCILALVCAVGFRAGVAFAQNPHWIKSSASCDSSTGDLLFSWKEVGLGDNLNIDYEFGAHAEVTCTCVTHSGKCPSAANKATASAEVVVNATFDVKNGQITRRNELVSAPDCPSSDPPTCGNGQILELSDIEYTDIHLTDITNNIDAPITPTSCTVTLFTCP